MRRQPGVTRDTIRGSLYVVHHAHPLVQAGGNTSMTGRVEDSSPWVGSQLSCRTCGSAGVIAPRTMWSETRLQRRRTYQAIVAHSVGWVITASAMSPQTR